MHRSTVTWQLEGCSVLVLHLEKLYWPGSGVAKRDLLRSSRSVVPVLLPFFRDRPVLLQLFPASVQRVSSWRRGLPEQAPAC